MAVQSSRASVKSLLYSLCLGRPVPQEIHGGITAHTAVQPAAGEGGGSGVDRGAACGRR